MGHDFDMAVDRVQQVLGINRAEVLSSGSQPNIVRARWLVCSRALPSSLARLFFFYSLPPYNSKREARSLIRCLNSSIFC